MAATIGSSDDWKEVAKRMAENYNHRQSSKIDVEALVDEVGGFAAGPGKAPTVTTIFGNVDEDDSRFKAYADEIMEDFKKQGKPTYTIERALQAKDITILAAGGSRI